MFDMPSFKTILAGSKRTTGHTDTECIRRRRHVPSKAYIDQLAKDDALLRCKQEFRAASMLHGLDINGTTYWYSKMKYWVGGNARCYIGRGPNDEFVAIKEMRRSSYPYVDKHSKTKPRALSDSDIVREYETCMLLGQSLRPVGGACTLKKAYLVMPLAQQDALSLALAPAAKPPLEIGAVDAVKQHTMPGRVAADSVDGFLAVLLRDSCTHLAAMHAVGVLHNDVKLNNIVFSTQSTGPGSFEMLDFGMSYDVTGGRYVGCNAYYGAPEAILHQRWVTHDRDDAAVQQRFKEDSYSLGLSCLWIVLGGGDAFEGLLPANLAHASPEEKRDAYLAFEYARRVALHDGSADKGMCADAWRSFQEAHPETAIQYDYVWQKVRERVSYRLFRVVSRLLAFEPEERSSAKGALATLCDITAVAGEPLSKAELLVRQRLQQAPAHELIKRHLRAACAAINATSAPADFNPNEISQGDSHE